jgi:FKBP-type peptidyl-prolyl cis-trans isomerase (trigger factor)
MARTKKAEIDRLLKERLRQIGAKGGTQTAKGLSKKERTERAKKAAAARWGKKPKKGE